MDIEVKQLIKSNLNPILYLLLFALYYKEEELLEYLKQFDHEKLLLELEELKYIKKSDTIVLRSKALTLFDKIEDNNPKIWYEQWRELFPEGLNLNGYYYRGNKQEVLHKLQIFCKKNPKITKDQIMLATKNYVDRSLRTRSYMLLAHYFIDKQGVGSTLLTEIENLNKVIPKTESINKMI